MSSRRTLILIAAALVGAIAAYALFTYVGGIEDEANDNAERVKIFKIVQDIPKGTFGDEAFAQASSSRTSSPRSTGRPRPSPTRRRSTAWSPSPTSPANQVVVSNQFVSQAESLSTFSSLLKNNEVAVTISVDQVRGVAGLLVPGDFVNMLVTVPSTQTATDGRRRPPEAGGERVRRSRPGTCTRRSRSSPSGRPASSSPARRPTPTPTARPPTSTSLRADHLRGAGRGGPADRLGRGVADLPDPRRQGLPARRPSPRSTPAPPLPGETGAQLTPYGPEGRPES